VPGAVIRQESTIDHDHLNEASELADLVLDARYSLEHVDLFMKLLSEHGDRPRIGDTMVAFLTSNAELYEGLKFLEAKIAATPVRDDERLVLGLLAGDRFWELTARLRAEHGPGATEPLVDISRAEPVVVRCPAGLRAQADRLSRVHADRDPDGAGAALVLVRVRDDLTIIELW
jgi:hypothetical protein